MRRRLRRSRGDRGDSEKVGNIGGVVCPWLCGHNLACFCIHPSRALVFNIVRTNVCAWWLTYLFLVAGGVLVATQLLLVRCDTPPHLPPPLPLFHFPLTLYLFLPQLHCPLPYRPSSSPPPPSLIILAPFPLLSSSHHRPSPLSL